MLIWLGVHIIIGESGYSMDSGYRLKFSRRAEQDISAARKVDKKIVNFLLKVAQK